MVKDEEGDKTFEAGKPVTAPVTVTAEGNGTGATSQVAPKGQAEGTKRKAEDKDGVDGTGDAKKVKA